MTADMADLLPNDRVLLAFPDMDVDLSSGPSQSTSSASAPDDRVDGNLAAESSSAESSVEQKVYDCCICNQSAPSTAHRLIGLVTFLQPTSG